MTPSLLSKPHLVGPTFSQHSLSAKSSSAAVIEGLPTIPEYTPYSLIPDSNIIYADAPGTHRVVAPVPQMYDVHYTSPTMPRFEAWQYPSELSIDLPPNLFQSDGTMLQLQANSDRRIELLTSQAGFNVPSDWYCHSVSDGKDPVLNPSAMRCRPLFPKRERDHNVVDETPPPKRQQSVGVQSCTNCRFNGIECERVSQVYPYIGFKIPLTSLSC